MVDPLKILPVRKNTQMNFSDKGSSINDVTVKIYFFLRTSFSKFRAVKSRVCKKFIMEDLCFLSLWYISFIWQ